MIRTWQYPPVRKKPIVVALLVLLVVVVAGGLVAWHAWVSVPDEALVADVLRMGADPASRPSHVDAPVAGSFGEHFAAAAEVLRVSRTLSPAKDAEQAKNRNAVLDGSAPWSTLSPEWRETLRTGRDAVHAVLEATHAESARPAVGMTLLDDPANPLQSDGYLLAQYSMFLAGLEIVESTAAGHPDQASEECVDAMAVGRDLAWGMGILGPTMGVLTQRILASPCARAFDAASVPAKRSGLKRLGIVDAGMPPFSHALEQERVYQELLVSHSFLSAERRGRLPAGAQAAAAAWEGGTFLETLALRAGGRRRLALAREVQASADLPLPELKPALARVNAEAEASVLQRSIFADPTRYATRYALNRSQLSVLRTGIAADIFQAETGKWPAAPADLVTAHFFEAPPNDIRTGATVSFVSSNGNLVVPSEDFPISIVVDGAPPSENVPRLSFHPERAPAR